MLVKSFRREYLPRKYFYIKTGDVTKQKAYINKGCVRYFTVDDKGREHISLFAFEDWWIGDIQSYITGEPGTLNIQAIEDCELLCISKTGFEVLMTQIPKLQDYETAKRQRNFFATIGRLNEVKTLSPEERYLKLIEKHPAIFQRVPLQYIASFLDIEPPSLSRLRKRLSNR